MRRRAWLAWLVLAAGLGVGVAGAHLPGKAAWDLLSGLLVLAAAALGVSLLPWGRWFPAVQPMPGLFARPSPRERWCTQCGSVTSRGGPCRRCGHTPASRGK